MKNEDDNIQFEQMPNLDWSWGSKQETQTIEKEYDSLYDELVDKCNPSNFKLEGLGKFNIANEIYARLQQMGTGISYETELRVLRNRAMDELGLYVSTKKTFDRLQTFLDPDNYTGRQPYDKELVENAGRLYTQLMQNKDDIRALELIESLPMTERILEEYEYQELTPEKYIERYPKGIHVDEANKVIEQKVIAETEYFKKHSATEYLSKYPQGIHSMQARRFLEVSPKKYLRLYPNGRYKQDAKSSIRGAIIFAVFISVTLIAAVVASILANIN